MLLCAMKMLNVFALREYGPTEWRKAPWSVFGEHGQWGRVRKCMQWTVSKAERLEQGLMVWWARGLERTFSATLWRTFNSGVNGGKFILGILWKKSFLGESLEAGLHYSAWSRELLPDVDDTTSLTPSTCTGNLLQCGLWDKAWAAWTSWEALLLWDLRLV